ncbi:transcription factor [Crepidotus variabilis]|uniref:Transcription factor n=1 Tax=Crepidotus variabilis TaxID=179855 RepID=A0A9P6EIB0_9AGAR|nr:transcription factor [Crepidotus variabilis]
MSLVIQNLAKHDTRQTHRWQIFVAINSSPFHLPSAFEFVDPNRLKMSMKAIVKSVLSGDTLILRGRAGPAQGQPPKERVLHLADLAAPRLGTSTREDEPWAYEAREFLRALTVGKEISFTSIHSLPAGNDDVLRDLGNAEVGGVDLSAELLKNGWAKVKEIKREPTEEDNRRRDLEAEAKAAGKGVWNPHGPQARVVNHSMPVDSQAFVAEWRGKPIDALVEQVRDGTTVRVRLYMPDGDHQMANITLAGVKSPRASSKQGEISEPFGEEAKYFTESRLLQRPVRAQILSLPTATATPFQVNANAAAPPPASVFIGTVLHPAGNVAEHLVANGLARIVEWHAGMLASSGGMEKLRSAEKSAKEKRLNLYASQPSNSSAAGASSTTPSGGSREYDATVIRIWSGDQVSVVTKEGKERRLQLSSTRGPKLSDPRQATYAQEAKEFLRKKLIGKSVKIHIDFIRPKEGEFDERECATIRYGGHNANVAEQLVEKGLASVVRHKRDDEDRSPDYDKLMAAEQLAVNEKRGIHSGKEVPPVKPPMNISENSTRAQTFMNNFKRLGKVPAIVEYVAAGSRFKIFLPKDNQTLTLVLAGIRAPKTARNASEKSEPFGNEASEFALHRYMQRDVEFEVESTDKSGGFIGTLYVNKTENAALTLVKEGYASVHDYSAEGLSWARQLREAEEEAKKARKNIWGDYDEEAVKAAAAAEEVKTDSGPLKSEYIDIIISDVRVKNGFSFSVQILNTEGIAHLEKLMRDFAQHHRSSISVPAGFVPKGGDLVSAKFSDGAWYRAKIRRASALKKEAEVTFIDYGNQDIIPFSSIRPLDPKFRSLPGQAHDARLSFVKLAPPESEYHDEAISRFRSTCEGRKLIANTDHKDGQVLHLRLIDSQNPTSAEDPWACINADLVAEGLASVDRKNCRYLQAYPQMVKKLQSSVQEAKRSRAGMFEFGDVEEDED